MLLKDVIKNANCAAMYCIDNLLTLMWWKTPHTERVLVIRLDAIGDFILWIDAAQAIVRYYKAQGKRVTLLANAVWASWAKELAIFDDVIALERRKYERNLLYRFRLGYRIRMLACAIVVQPTYSREWLLGDSIVRISRALERIGSSGNGSNITELQKSVSDRWYTRIVYSDPSPQMELIRNAEFVRNLCKIDFQAKLPDLRAATALQLDEVFAAAIKDREQYYVLFPGASWEGKQWPVASFAQIAQQIHSRTRWYGVVCGGPKDRAVADDLCKQCSAPLLNWAGRTGLSQLAAILAAAQLVLANDTSATHIAAACGVPTVCILGGGHYERFMPYEVEFEDGRPLPHAIAHKMPCFGCNWRCIYERSKGAPVACIKQISVDDVWHIISGITGTTE
jgi:ADP-heptose:LPS heptosyltransferase